MPRQARIDVPGQYYHVISRGIERREIFSGEEDYADFLGRAGDWLKKCESKCLAWCLMPNHFHFLIQRGARPLSELMHHVMTGYAVNYNLRRQRCGHLFQNRYKAIICEVDSYFQELAPYIHLNPLRAKFVKDLDDLLNYRWCGHRALVSGVPDGVMDAQALLAHYGNSSSDPLTNYMHVLREKAEEAERLEAAGDARRARPDLEKEDFLGNILRKAEVLAVKPRRDRAELLAEAARLTGVSCAEILRPSRLRAAARARAIYCCLCREQSGISGAELMVELRVNQSAVSKLIGKGRVLLGALN